MATTPGGLTYPIATDAFDPSGDIAALAAAADAGRIIAVPNVAARAALAAATTARPLYVHRADATTGRELERTTDGTTWTVYDTAPLLTKTYSVSGVSVPANGRNAANAGTLEVPAGYTHIGFATVSTINGDNVVAAATLLGTAVWIHFQSKWAAALTVSGTVTALFARA